MVYLGEFWAWAEKNRSFLDFSKNGAPGTGEEPDWLPGQRRKDYEAYALQRKDAWTPTEDSRLKMLVSLHKYSWAEISDMMHRSHGAISRRCRDLGIKDRPVAMELTGKRGTWSPEDFEALVDGYSQWRQLRRHREGRRPVGEMCPLQGLQRLPDRKTWTRCVKCSATDPGIRSPGDGRQAQLHISRTRQADRRDLSTLAALLRKRMNDLGMTPTGSGLCA
ncbi:MAG: Myb-like DNA-binding domain-containing protein [Alistipes putredinis]|uniref:Myb-like DNA-binding domain-containing protein n=1 Tax=Alistipes putredinis TaxID=28117 RepID=UPI0039A3A2A5